MIFIHINVSYVVHTCLMFHIFFLSYSLTFIFYLLGRYLPVFLYSLFFCAQVNHLNICFNLHKIGFDQKNKFIFYLFDFVWRAYVNSVCVSQICIMGKHEIIKYWYLYECTYICFFMFSLCLCESIMAMIDV